jgi:hypothetical protein
MTQLGADDLCALGVIGQRDRLVVAVDAALPVSTVADLAAVAPASPWRPAPTTASISSGSPRTGACGWPESTRQAELPLRRAALPRARRVRRRDVDVVINAAIMAPHWQRIVVASGCCH